ncbi:hypothetical protein AB0C12_03515 [Actinoplanes sp. NPDC048967]|uniref:hypothetical protein n=1 Tax=Actinoplanes sp. NPDC048967 TaxID=3155269 RepID=UPI0033C05710
MLDAEARLLLTPRLAMFRQVTEALAADQRQLAETTAELTGQPATGRLFSGSLGKDLATVKRIRELRRSQRELTVRVEEQQASAEQLAEQIDGLVDPVLRLHDGHYQRLVVATLLLTQALAHCEEVGRHLGSAVGAAGTVMRAVMGKATGSTDQFRAEWAARGYDNHIRDAVTGLRALPDQVLRIEHRVAELTRTTVRPVRMPDPALVDEVPPTLASAGARLRLAEGLVPLGSLQRQLRATTGLIEQRRAQADKKRQAALRAAYSRL